MDNFRPIEVLDDFIADHRQLKLNLDFLKFIPDDRPSTLFCALQKSRRPEDNGKAGYRFRLGSIAIPALADALPQHWHPSDMDIRGKMKI